MTAAWPRSDTEREALLASGRVLDFWTRLLIESRSDFRSELDSGGLRELEFAAVHAEFEVVPYYSY